MHLGVEISSAQNTAVVCHPQLSPLRLEHLLREVNKGQGAESRNSDTPQRKSSSLEGRNIPLEMTSTAIHRETSKTQSPQHETQLCLSSLTRDGCIRGPLLNIRHYNSLFYIKLTAAKGIQSDSAL